METENINVLIDNINFFKVGEFCIEKVNNGSLRFYKVGRSFPCRDFPVWLKDESQAAVYMRGFIDALELMRNRG